MFEVLRDRREVLTRVEMSNLSRFKARLEFTRRFRSLVMHDMSDATADAYFVLAKLGFAYSCVEALQKLIGPGHHITIFDAAFHEALSAGEFKKLTDHLDKMALENLLKRGKSAEKRVSELEVFKADPPRDLAPYVRHCRHVVFHASVTPSTLSLQASKRRRNLLLGLANNSLLSVEHEFAKWVKQIEARGTL